MPLHWHQTPSLISEWIFSQGSIPSYLFHQPMCCLKNKKSKENSAERKWFIKVYIHLKMTFKRSQNLLGSTQDPFSVIWGDTWHPNRPTAYFQSRDRTRQLSRWSTLCPPGRHRIAHLIHRGNHTIGGRLQVESVLIPRPGNCCQDAARINTLLHAFT